MRSSVSRILALIPLILATALSLQPALAQSNSAVEARLRSDVVTEQEGKFTIDRFSICQLVRPVTLGGGATDPFQVKSHMEAPADGFISRDNFVTFSTEVAFQLRVDFASQFIQGLTPSEALAALLCKQIESPIGKVDLELDLYMTRDGVQVGIRETSSGESETQTRTWNQMLGQ
jgi:hypothetical protein